MKGLRKLLIEKLGGYTERGYKNAEEAIEAVEDPKERRRLLTLAVKICFNTIGEEDILQVTENGTWMLSGRTMTVAERDRLIAEAQQFEQTLLWRALEADVKHQANKVTFLKARSADDLVAGKLWHYTFYVMRKRIRSIARGTTDLLPNKLLKNKPK